MKKFILVFVIVVLFIIPLKSTIMTLGFHYHVGQTFTDKWKNIHPDTYVVNEWDTEFSGYFVQLLFQLDKINIGLEFGKGQFYSYEGESEPGIYLPWGYGIWETFNPIRVLAIMQFEIKKKILFQSGIGIYPEGPSFGLIKPEGPHLGLMSSVRYHVKVGNILEIPLFVRADLNSKRGTPVVFSFGTGIVLKWKSGL